MSKPLRKWYFCVNEHGLKRSGRMVHAAVKSCLRNTSLAPHCLYIGGGGDHVRALRGLGVTVIPHKPSLAPELRAAYGDKFGQFAGHWLRLDIPQLETEDDVILYTDIDVVFRAMPARLALPELIAVAPEHRRSDWSHFNSGVMLMNLPRLREIDREFKAAVRARLAGDFTYPTHDQASYNAFFAGRYDRLPLSLNWKPYWGVNPRAHIVHFHGPKPGLVRTFQAKGPGNRQGGLATIWQRDPEAYETYLAEFEAACAPLDRNAPRPARITEVATPLRARLPERLRRAGHRITDGLHAASEGLSRLLSSPR